MALSPAHEKAAIATVVDLPGHGLTGGTGFLAMIDGDAYFVTVAHCATRLASSPSTWETWADQIHIVQSPPLTLGAAIQVFESPRVSWRLGHLEPAPLGTGV